GHGLVVCLDHTMIAMHQGLQGYALGRGKGQVISKSFLGKIRPPDTPLVLAFAQLSVQQLAKLCGIHLASKAKGCRALALPLHCGTVLGVIVICSARVVVGHLAAFLPRQNRGCNHPTVSPMAACVGSMPGTGWLRVYSVTSSLNLPTGSLPGKA